MKIIEKNLNNTKFEFLINENIILMKRNDNFIEMIDTFYNHHLYFQDNKLHGNCMINNQYYNFKMGNYVIEFMNNHTFLTNQLIQELKKN